MAAVMRRGARRGIAALLGAAVIAGCAPAPPFSAGFFSPPPLERLAEALPPVAVYAFADGRGTEPTLFLEVSSISGQFDRTYATEPVATGVTRAFVEGFRARGFPVIDETAKPYVPGTRADNARVAITGHVLAFGARIIRAGVYTFDQKVACRVVLEAHDAATGHTLWTKTYAQVTEGALAPGDPTTLLSRALAHVVEQAAMDRELLDIIRR